MKNIILINVDTERDQQIIIGKPEEIQKPQNREEAGIMITEDLTCVCEALCTLINMAADNGYADKKDLIDISIKRLTELAVNLTKEEEDASNPE